MLESRPLKNLSVHLENLVQGRLWLQVIIGLVVGAALGVLLNPSTGLFTEDFSSWLANWLDLPGQIFMRLVQMVMIPLIFASIVSGIVSNTSDNLKTFPAIVIIFRFHHHCFNNYRYDNHFNHEAWSICVFLRRITA